MLIIYTHALKYAITGIGKEQLVKLQVENPFMQPVFISFV